MAEEIGVERASKSKACLNCGEPFGWTELSHYMTRLKSQTIDCYRCQTENYIVRRKRGLYFLILLMAALIFLSIFLFVNLVYAYGTYDPYDDTFRVSYFMLFVGFALGMAGARIVLTLYHWKTGDLSLDKKYKSITDYDL